MPEGYQACRLALGSAVCSVVLCRRRRARGVGGCCRLLVGGATSTTASNRAMCSIAHAVSLDLRVDTASFCFSSTSIQWTVAPVRYFLGRSRLAALRPGGCVKYANKWRHLGVKTLASTNPFCIKPKALQSCIRISTCVVFPLASTKLSFAKLLSRC